MTLIPTWITPPGTLGTIPEGVFYRVPLSATSDQTVYYQLIAGKLPPGIEINEDGILSGNPSAGTSVEGIPVNVALDTTSQFAIRAYTEKVVSGVTVVDTLSDRTFSITVAGLNTVTWTTPAGSIGTYFDGTQITDLQVVYSNPDPYVTASVSLIGGALPTGLSISTTGVILGYIAPNLTATQTTTTYSFTLKVTNGVTSDTRSFSLLVYARSRMTADNTYVTADNTFITADTAPIQPPIITTPAGSIGTTRSDNFYAFQFTGVDFYSNPFHFIATTSLPPGLTLDPNTGWLYGYIPGSGLLSTEYTFGIRAVETGNPNNYSGVYSYNLTITGPVSSDIVWITTPGSLGTINNGATSTFSIQAINVAGIPLQYQLLSGSSSRLPQGLQLLPSGNIAGRVSFDTFALDGGTTTFDVNSKTVNQPTTFDMVCTFTVNVYSINGVVNVNQVFSITVVRAFNQPYDNLYIQAMPPQNDRDLIKSLVQNPTIFPPALIYRSDDPNFGVASRVIYEHAYGLTASVLDDYVASMSLNHYWKNLTLGEIKTAQALDDSGNVLYEVVYSEVVDTLVNNDDISVGKEVVLPFPITVNNTEVNVVYPNSLQDMRDQVIDVVGQISNVLPRWMLSRQTDGTVLGFTPAWVIAYTNPGQSGQIAYNIQTQFGTQLNLIDFTADRYELDNYLTENWDRADQHWVPQPPTLTTFDVSCHYQPTEFNGGTGYQGIVRAADGDITYTGDTILILGSQVGGIDGLNDITITVNTVNNLGVIQDVFYTGIAPLVSSGAVFNNISGTNISGSGVGALWTIEIVPGIATVFDGNSVQFTAPNDMYTPNNNTMYDDYLLFPKYNIIENVPSVNSPVYWTNNSYQTVGWVNNNNSTVDWTSDT